MIPVAKIIEKEISFSVFQGSGDFVALYYTSF